MTKFYGKPAVSLDTREFMRGLSRMQKKHIPKFVVDGIAETAEGARDEVRAITKVKFRLHSQWLINKIQYLPKTAAQRKASMRAFSRKGDFQAAVYLRPANNPRNSAAFMADHEFGDTRHPQNKYIAMPTKTLKQKNYKTARGRVRKRWKPEQLLKRFNAMSSRLDKGTTPNRGKKTGPQRERRPGNAFMMETKKGSPAIVRRTSKARTDLEFLYVFKRSAKVKPVWNFEPLVINVAMRDYRSKLRASFKRMPARL